MESSKDGVESVIAPLNKVTPVSKYVALVLFIILPFLGGWVGYLLAPVKIVDIERIVVREVAINNDVNTPEDSLVVSTTTTWEVYSSPNGFSISIPIGSEVVEEPAQLPFSAITNFSGAFGSMCISPGYGCGGKGAEGASIDKVTLTSKDDIEMKVTILRSVGDNSVIMVVQSLNPLPSKFSDSSQIQVFTTEENLAMAESMLKSIDFLE
jgi:hypothetical protein